MEVRGVGCEGNIKWTNGWWWLLLQEGLLDEGPGMCCGRRAEQREEDAFGVIDRACR